MAMGLTALCDITCKRIFGAILRNQPGEFTDDLIAPPTLMQGATKANH